MTEPDLTRTHEVIEILDHTMTFEEAAEKWEDYRNEKPDN